MTWFDVCVKHQPELVHHDACREQSTFGDCGMREEKERVLGVDGVRARVVRGREGVVEVGRRRGRPFQPGRCRSARFM